MKKYSTIVENGYADLVPDDNGDVVPASVAQALYDALRAIVDNGQFFSSAIELDHMYDGQQLERDVLSALSLADGEE